MVQQGIKNSFIFLIIFYQLFISPILKQLFGIRNSCRYVPSCSEYAGQAINKHGIVKGGYLFLVRLLQCQPFYSSKVKVQSSKLQMKIQKSITFNF